MKSLSNCAALIRYLEAMQADLIPPT